MDGIEQLLIVARAYAELEQIELSTVSSRVFDDGKKLKALEEGADINTRRFEAALQWFSEHWPDATWPAGIPRPTSVAREPVEART